MTIRDFLNSIKCNEKDMFAIWGNNGVTPINISCDRLEVLNMYSSLDLKKVKETKMTDYTIYMLTIV